MHVVLDGPDVSSGIATSKLDLYSFPPPPPPSLPNLFLPTRTTSGISTRASHFSTPRLVGIGRRDREGRRDAKETKEGFARYRSRGTQGKEGRGEEGREGEDEEDVWRGKGELKTPLLEIRSIADRPPRCKKIVAAAREVFTSLETTLASSSTPFFFSSPV